VILFVTKFVSSLSRECTLITSRRLGRALSAYARAYTKGPGSFNSTSTNYVSGGPSVEALENVNRSFSFILSSFFSESLNALVYEHKFDQVSKYFK
jgi:hypothetical protein